MIASSFVIPVLIAAVVLLITAGLNYAIAINNGLNGAKWFLKGLILPFISIIFLSQEVKRLKEKKRKEQKKSAPKQTVTVSEVKDEEDNNDVDLATEEKSVGLTYEELDLRKKRKQALLDEIKRKHQPKVDNLDITTSEELKTFMNGAWLYENPKNASIFQVFIFNDFTLKVDASFPRFAVSEKEISYTVTLMGNYLRIQDKPQKILITGRKEAIIGNRKLVKMTKKDHKDLEDLLFTVNSDAELLFGSAVKANDKSNISAV